MRSVWTLGLMLAALVWTAGIGAQQDVICSNMGAITKNGTVGDITAYSLSSTSCNIGNQVADWFDNTNQHPLIGGNIYRIKDGHLEQLGMGWLKHSFCAVNENSCGNCQDTPCSTLGVGCADTYSTGLNGSQGNLGPRSDVNATTGLYNWPFPTDGQTGNAIYKRVQCHNVDIDPAFNTGALYFGVIHYMCTDEPDLGIQQHFNNNSYRMLNVGSFSSGGWNLSYTGSTQQQKDPIQAWQDNLPGEVERDVVLPPEASGESMMVVGTRVEDLGGGMWRYQYAIFNDSSHRSARSFIVPVSPSATLSNIKFTDVDYHSGEPYSLTDWTVTQTANSIEWSTQTFNQNANANAIRWGTTYSFGFDANAPPQEVGATIGLFRNPAGASIGVNVEGPADPPPIEFSYPAGVPTLIDNIGGSFQVNIDAVGGATLDPTSPTLHYDSGSGYQTTPLVSLGGDLYEAQFPALACAINVDFYLSAETTGATTVNDPPSAPSVAYSAVTGDMITQDIDELETDTGWTAGAAGDSATTGVWERVNPIGTAAQPEDDHTPTGTICWVTGQGSVGGSLGENDVDGGHTTLLTPVYDMSLMNDPTISYWRWYSNDEGGSPNADVFTVDIRSSGNNWQNVEVVGPSGAGTSGGWVFVEFRVLDEVASLTSTIQMRFIAEDAGGGSIVEAAIDDFIISDITCDLGVPIFTRGDCNGDGGNDISDPINLLEGVFGSGTLSCLDACDVNDDGTVQLDDALYMLNHQFQQGPDPLAPYPGCGPDPSADGLAECMGATGCP